MRKSACNPSGAAVGETAEIVLERQARRHRRRGEYRREMITLRQACSRAQSDARLWTLYGAACMRAGRHEDAVRALSQAVWLRERSRDHARAEVTRSILDAWKHGTFAHGVRGSTKQRVA